MYSTFVHIVMFDCSQKGNVCYDNINEICVERDTEPHPHLDSPMYQHSRYPSRENKP